MAKGINKEVVEELQAEIDYSTYTKDQLLEAIGQAYANKAMKLMGMLSKLYTKAEAVEEKAKKDALMAELEKLQIEVKKRFNKLAHELVDSGVLDGADGVWYAWDFGDQLDSIRLTKGSRKAAGEGGGSAGKSSYKAGLPPSEDMLKEVGDAVYFEADTAVTIDKREQTMPAGMTYREAYNFSTNGGWRNRVRMALGRATSRI